MRILLSLYNVAIILMVAFHPAARAEDGAVEHLPAPGMEFRDCAACPPMVVMPLGSFTMGSPASEEGRSPNEGPMHKVTFAHPFAIAKHEVTFAEWDLCVADRACKMRTDDQGFGRELRPATEVSWFDVEDYLHWLSEKTGKSYRLPSGAEWEYGARAGTTTRYAWGKTASHDFANYGADTCCNNRVLGRDKWLKSAPVESFRANAFGLYDMAGNVWEWVDDCGHESYDGAPADGGPNHTGDCTLHDQRGGSFGSLPVRIRPAFHDAYPPGDHDDFIGFRVARSE